MKTFRLFVVEETKYDKGDVLYTDRASKHTERCELCEHFRLAPPDFETAKCSIVEGIISKDGWCKEFERSNAK